MKNEMTSSILGKLQQDEAIADLWTSKEIEIPFFDNEVLPITFMDFECEKDPTFSEEADRALANFLQLNASDRNELSAIVYKIYLNYLDIEGFDEADEPLREISDKNNIWSFIQPTEISISRLPDMKHDMYLSVYCDCDWELENGIQFIFRKGKNLITICEQDNF